MTTLITDNKKIEYLYNALLSQYSQDTAPKFTEFIRGYMRFLDQSYIQNTLNILKNNNINTIYSNMLDDYMNDYFNGVIDENRFSLTDANKRLFLSLSKMIHNLKGNKKSFDFMFRSFSDFIIADPGGDISIDKIAIQYYEDESWWDPSDVDYYDGTYDHDGTIDYTAAFQKPFTYRFTVDQSPALAAEIIRNVHPAGFFYEILINMEFDDIQRQAEEAETEVTYYFYYNQTNTQWKHDGVAYYSASKTYTTTF